MLNFIHWNLPAAEANVYVREIKTVRMEKVQEKKSAVNIYFNCKYGRQCHEKLVQIDYSDRTKVKENSVRYVH